MGVKVNRILVTSALVISGATISYVLYRYWKSGKNIQDDLRKKAPSDIKDDSKEETFDEVKTADLTESHQANDVQQVAEKSDSENLVTETTEKILDLAVEARIKGNKYYNASKYDKAIECYSEALRYYPSDHEGVVLSLSNRAACYIRKENFDAVVIDCTSALSINPNFIKALDRRSRAFEALNRLEDAASDVLAMWYIENGKNQETEQKLQRLLETIAEIETSKISKLAPRIPSPICVYERLCNYGIILPAFEESLDQIESAIKVSKDISELLFKKAVILIQKRSYEAAFGVLQECMNQSSKSCPIEAYYTYALFCYLIGDIPNALKYVNICLTLDERNVFALVMKASWEHELGRVNEALENINKAIETNPNHPLPYLQRSFFVSLFNPLSAKADVEKGLELDGNFIQLHIQQSRIFLVLDEPSKALQVLENGIKAFPNDFDILNGYTELLVALPREITGKSDEEILKLIGKCISLRPFDPRCFIAKGSFYIRRQEFELAIESLNAAIKAEPTFQFPYFELAMIYVVQGDREKALSAMNNGIDMITNQKEAFNSFKVVADLKTQLNVLERYPQFKETFKNSF